MAVEMKQLGREREDGGFEKIDMDFVSHKDLQLPISITNEKAKEPFSLRMDQIYDMSHGEDEELNPSKEISIYGTMQYILLTRSVFTKEWKVPERYLFHDGK